MIQLLGVHISESKVSNVVENLMENVLSNTKRAPEKSQSLLNPQTVEKKSIPQPSTSNEEIPTPTTSGTRPKTTISKQTTNAQPPLKAKPTDRNPEQKKQPAKNKATNHPPFIQVSIPGMEDMQYPEAFLNSLDLPTEFGKKFPHNESFDSSDSSMNQEMDEDLELC